MSTKTRVVKCINKIALAKFCYRLVIVLDINPLQNLIKTQYRDIILNNAYANKFYLCRVSLFPSRGEEFKYRYNLLKGHIGMDCALIYIIEGAEVSSI